MVVTRAARVVAVLAATALAGFGAAAPAAAAHRDLGDRWRQAGVPDAMAAAHLALGNPARTAELTGLAAALRDDLGVPVPAVDVPGVEQVRVAAVELLGDRRWQAAVAGGATLSVQDVIGT